MNKILLMLLICIAAPTVQAQDVFVPAQAAAPAASGLKDSLVAYWTMDEASGDRADSHTGGYTLSDINTVASGTGKIDTASSFVLGNSEALVSRSFPVTFDDNDWTVAMWVKTPAEFTLWAIIMGRDSLTGLRSWNLQCANGATGLMRFNYRSVESGNENVTSTIELSAETWYWVVIWHSKSSGTAGRHYIQINNSATIDSVDSGGPSDDDGTTPLTFGYVPGQGYWTGMSDEVAIWRGRILTAANKTTLYNSGSGKAFSTW